MLNVGRFGPDLRPLFPAKGPKRVEVVSYTTFMLSNQDLTTIIKHHNEAILNYSSVMVHAWMYL